MEKVAGFVPSRFGAGSCLNRPKGGVPLPANGLDASEQRAVVLVVDDLIHLFRRAATMEQERPNELLVPRIAQLLLQPVGLPIVLVPLAAVMLVGVERVTADSALVRFLRVALLPAAYRGVRFAPGAVRKNRVHAEVGVAERGQRDVDRQLPADCRLQRLDEVPHVLVLWVVVVAGGVQKFVQELGLHTPQGRVYPETVPERGRHRERRPEPVLQVALLDDAP